MKQNSSKSMEFQKSSNIIFCVSVISFTACGDHTV